MLNIAYIQRLGRNFYLLTAVLLILFLNNKCGIVTGKELMTVESGKNVTIDCLSSSKNIVWQRNNENISFIDRLILSSVLDSSNGFTTYKHTLNIINTQLSDEGIYSCKMNYTTNETVGFHVIQPFIKPTIVSYNGDKIKQKIGHSIILFCLVHAYPLDDAFKNRIKWTKDDNLLPHLEDLTNVTQLNTTYINITLELTEIYKKENGTYNCMIPSSFDYGIKKKDISLLVMDVPQVSIDYVKAVGMSRIFLNWTVNDGNDPVQKYFVQYMQEGSPTFTYYNHIIDGKNTSYVLENFLPNTSYLLRMSAKNSIGNGAHHQYPQSIRTLERDPVFIPKVETTGSTASTITIGWDPPMGEILEYIQFYELVVSTTGDNPKIIEEAIYPQNSRNLPYMFDNLKTATAYEFKVRACNDLTKLCGPWSDVVNGTTMDGVASVPTDLKVICSNHNVSGLNSVIVSWSAPKTPNGKVVSYLIQLEGKSAYKVDGKLHNETWGPKIRRVDEPHHKTVYEGVNANTNYTVTVSAITRHKKAGEPSIGKCRMPISAPDSINRIMWTKIKTSNNKCFFKMYMPKISERNGPICCYRIFLVRMNNNKNELPPPNFLNVTTYYEVHSINNSYGGAYLAEMFSGDYFKSELFLGDGKSFYEIRNTNMEIANQKCQQCFEGISSNKSNDFKTNVNINTRVEPSITHVKEALHNNHINTSEYQANTSLEFIEKNIRLRRNPKVVAQNNHQELIENMQDLMDTKNIFSLGYSVHQLQAYDGEIDMNSNYTGFLEVIVRDNQKILTAYSHYFEVMTPGSSSVEYYDISYVFNIVIHGFGILVGIVLLLLITLCTLHHCNKKGSGTAEEVSLRDSLSKALCGGRTGHHRHFIGTTTGRSSDIGPVSKSDLLQAYKNRHKDTDYGFLREYEMLPSRFNDRTTKHSDLKENSIKNRYPDIKAYDQTRVKLAQLNGNQSSDYINANFVIGYKERKKFICAQGPMDGTINDFWRMIWEQHLEIIVMLTNLEEYNKTKCAKYWPEKISDYKQFGDIAVKFVSEQRSGDFLVRNLEISKRLILNEYDEDRRQITQYHYLVWKDFMAPEHPHGIIKFIRTINSVYSVQRGPILVHCSAGVGRTGTLVALDSLMQQIEEEEQVSIFNTVCDLRHQRNFLVQSLKQYIFLYRALLECAHFGNTELSANSLTTTIENLKTKQLETKDKCKLEIEFEKLQTAIDESHKACTVGNIEENLSKNRSSYVIPYDRNRVILSPIPMREHSTYINASFIEGYDNLDHFIITQDPMENTVADFWRMISEQSITTLVMISEIGDGPRKCPRYWADDEIQYEHILVKYLQSESCPYYTRREFNVTNCKIDDTIKVTQFQYNGWPTVDGEVPEVCRGIIELVDQAQTHHSKEKNFVNNSPITVHCSLGTDRSSIFVAMCILVQQLRTERRIDICTTARKLRSQRTKLLDTYAQYEFLHRAIANYSDLHNLSTEPAE